MTDQKTPDQFIEIEPYQETGIPSRPPMLVYHQSDEEQTAIIRAGTGDVELRGPHDWTVQVNAGDQLAELIVTLDQAKVRHDHGDAPYDPDLAALFRAAEKVIALFPDNSRRP